MSKLFKIIMATVMLGLFVYGCDSGTSSRSNVANNIVSGIAAAGAPIIGTVTIKDINGTTFSTPINDDGSFNIDVSGMTPPFILFAEGSVYGESITAYSIIDGAGSVNITPITNLILTKVANGDIDTVYEEWISSQIDVNDVNAMETIVTDNLSPVLEASGVSGNISLMSDSFVTDQTGVDLVLDSLDISYEGDVATVTHTATGLSYTDDITAGFSSTATGFDLSDYTEFVAADGDQSEIVRIYKLMETMYTNSIPDVSTADSIMGPYMHDDYFWNGMTKDEKYSWWASMTPNCIGLTNRVGKITKIDNLEMILGIEPNSKRAYMVNSRADCSHAFRDRNDGIVIFTGDNPGEGLSLLGNRLWIDGFVFARATYSNYSDTISGFDSGIAMTLTDSTHYAYNNGIRSAILTGPGMPVEGVVAEMYFDENANRYTMFASQEITEYLPDNSVYTIRIYTESSDEVSLDATPVQTFTYVVPKSPLLLEEVEAGQFPTLINPSTHDISEYTIPGEHFINWTTPLDIWVTNALIFWYDPDNKRLGESIPYRETSITLDTTSFDYGGDTFPADRIWLTAYDVYNRQYNLSWSFNTP